MTVEVSLSVPENVKQFGTMCALFLPFAASLDGIVLDEKDGDDQYRCQTCTKTFPNVDDLYDHQNELGHLELKQTPRGPGYLCWKKGCNQYFKTANALQMHFKEIHARKPAVAISERHMYKFRCQNCSLAFKSLEKLQLHTFYHIIRAATKCIVCGRTFRSITGMRKHVEGTHLESMSAAEMERYRASLASTAPLSMLGLPGAEIPLNPALMMGGFPGQIPGLMLPALPFPPLPLPGQLPPTYSMSGHPSATATAPPPNDAQLPKDPRISQCEPEEAPESNAAEKEEIRKMEESDNQCMTQDDQGDDVSDDKEKPRDSPDDTSQETRDSVHSEDSGAQSGDSGPSADYKEEHFLEDYINSQAIAENSYSDPSRKYKCHRCKVAFTKQNYLSAHNKTLMHRKGDKLSYYPVEKYLDPNRPYKCDVCKESFTQKNILLVHYNSVSHLHKLKQVSHQDQDDKKDEQEISSGSSKASATTAPADNTEPGNGEPGESVVIKTEDPKPSSESVERDLARTPVSAPVIADPDRKPYKCNICKVAYSQVATLDIHMRSVLHQTKASRIQDLAQSGQLDLSQPLIEQPESNPSKAQLAAQEQHRKILADMIQKMPGGQFQTGLPGLPPLPPLTSLPTGVPGLLPPPPRPISVSTPSTTAEPSTTKPSPVAADTPQASPKVGPGAAEQPTYLCPRCNASFPSQDTLQQHHQVCLMQTAMQRGIPRFKPHVQRNLLENIGFECVMQFNEFFQKPKKPKETNTDEKEIPTEMEKSETQADVSPIEKEEEEEKEVVTGDDDNEMKTEIKTEPKDDVDSADKVDLPEINKCVCSTCHKQFSSIWVLKAHQEEVHHQIVPIKFVENFSQKFKEDYDKKQQSCVTSVTDATEKSCETPSVSAAPSLGDSKPPSMPSLDEAALAMSYPNLGLDLATAQAMQMMQMPMFMNSMIPGMPGLGMPMGMNMIPPLIPPMMPPDMYPGFPMVDPTSMLAQQQQAAALAAQQQKRARTRINDEQLKILRNYFDINNSPSEEQILEMSDKSGLPPKVIKHWFRNTLFKERQRNKDSPYNFSVPPATKLNLEEYERTGRIQPADGLDNPMNSSLGSESQREGHSPRSSAPQPSSQHSNSFSKWLDSQEKERSLSRQQSPGSSSKLFLPNPPQELEEIARSQQQQQQSSQQRSLEAQDIGNQDNMDRDSVMSLGDSMLSSSPSTPAQTPTPNTSMMHLTPASSTTGLGPVMPASSLNQVLPPSSLPFGDFPLLPMAGPPPPIPPMSTSTPLLPPPIVTPQSSQAKPPSNPVTPNRSQPSTSPQSSGSMSGKRANRTRFTDYQIKVLQEYFEQNAYPKDDDLEHLSKLLNLSPRVIVVWFQNARQKARKNYENQPPLDMSGDENSRFTRTPGLNYQCKKCFTVFQRYYELIKHQRTHCYKDEKKIPLTFAQSSRESSRRTSIDRDESNDSSKSLSLSNTPVSTTPAKDSLRSPPVSSISSSSSGESPASASAPAAGSGASSRAKVTEFQCEKCSLSFPRLDLWREHQNIHSMNPSLFSPFPSTSAFAMLQSVAAQQQQQPVSMSQSGVALTNSTYSHGPVSPAVSQQSPPSSLPDRSPYKRQHEDDDDRDDQPRDKRMRTTILPEQLDYLYQKYQLDCNPSRKQLETIALEVGLKKRVVQVWFQNTRARERKGQYRAHQQLIHKRCPFCRALFRAKSALESHLATKHPEEMARGDINVDNIPDESASSEGSLHDDSSPSSSAPRLDMAKLLNNPYNVPPPFMPMVSPPGPGSSSGDPLQSNMKRMYEDSLKKYLDELSHVSHKSRGPESSQDSHHMGHLDHIKQESEDIPLDLSKPIRGGSESAEVLSHRYAMEDSRFETHSDSTDNNDEQSQMESFPASPSSSTSSNQPANRSGNLTPHKRYRTQMSSLQIRVMKSLFHDYKTPTMAECEMLGQQIDLPKRVIQVWFQNARAKEKKSKLAMSKTFGNEMDFQRPPEECKLCSFKYSHKYTIQDHIFTHRHIDNVKRHIQLQSDGEDSGTAQGATPSSNPGGRDKDGSVSGHPHLAQLQAMGLQARASAGKKITETITHELNGGNGLFI